MAHPRDFVRLLGRSDVRNLSYIELLLIIVFTSILLFSFASSDLSDAKGEIKTKNQEIEAANKALASRKAEIDKAKEELEKNCAPLTTR
jgi:hypothetical protein